MEHHASNTPPNPAGFVDIGEKIVCKCGIVLGQRKDRNTISISKPIKGGAAVHIKAEYHGGPFKISCPLCGFGAIFAHFEESLHTQDSIVPRASEG